MDDDLKQVLDAIREENAAAHADTRRRLETAEVKNETAHADTRRRFEAAEVKNETAHAQTRRQFDAMAEFQQHKLDLVIERVLSNGGKIDQLEAKVDQVVSDHEARITRLEVATSLQGRI